MANKFSPTETMQKIVAVAELLIGAGQLASGLMTLLDLMPKLNTVYEDFAVNRSAVGNIPMVVLVLLGVANLVLGGLLLSNFAKNKQMLFWFGIISIIISLIATPILFSIGSLLSLSPLYNLAN